MYYDVMYYHDFKIMEKIQFILFGAVLLLVTMLIVSQESILINFLTSTLIILFINLVLLISKYQLGCVL